MHLKRVKTVILLVIASFLGTIIMKAATAQNSQINSLLKQIENKIPENYRYPEAIVEGKSWQKSSEFAQLQSVIQTTWPTLLNNLQTVAPSEVNKTILFVAMQSLSTDNYLQFLDKAVGLAEAKSVDKHLLKWALFPADKNVRGVLDYNYDKPIARDILQRVKLLYAGDQDMVNYCNATLSGETKRNAERYFNDNPSEPRPPVIAAAMNSAPAVPTAAVPTPITSVPTSMPIASPAPTAPVAKAPVAVVEKAPMWPWVVGIVVFITILTLVFKRHT